MSIIPEDVNIEAELEKAEAPETPEETEAPAPEKTEEPAEPVSEPPKDAVESKPKEKRGDPTIALRQARQEAKELKEQLRRKDIEDGQKYAALQARLDALTNPPAEKPEFDTDPAGYLKARVDDLDKETAQTKREREQQNVERQITSRIQGAEQSFMKEHPDYRDAVIHYVNVMSKNMEVLGVIPENQRTEAIRQEILRLGAMAVQRGKDPAELVYEIARTTGFTGKTKVANEEKLETIERGQEASSTLGSGSRADAGKLTLDSLAKMDDDEFNSLIGDEKKWKQIGSIMH